MKFFKKLAFFLLFSFLLVPKTTKAANPEIWPMFQRDNRHIGRSDFIGPNQPQVYWKYLSMGGNVDDASLSVGNDGTVYVGSAAGSVFAFSSDGVFKWYYDAASPITNAPAVTDDGTV